MQLRKWPFYIYTALFWHWQAFVRHSQAYETKGGDFYIANNPGMFHWRSGGESHINDPMPIAELQDAAKRNSVEAFKKFSDYTNGHPRKCTLRCVL